MTAEYIIFSEKNGNLREAAEFYESMGAHCPYNYPPYLNILSNHLYDNLELNVFALRTGNGKIFYPFFKRDLRNIRQVPDEFSVYSDIISSWYYGGPLISKTGKEAELLNLFTKSFVEYCHRERIIAEFVRFDPNIENHEFFSDYYHIEYNRETISINLQKPYEEIWNGYEGRCRTAVRKAIKSGVTVTEDQSARQVDEFFDIYQAEMERKADSKHYFFERDFFHELVMALPENFKYFFAYYNKILCGGTIVYLKDGIAYDFLMATNINHWKYQPNNILLDYAIQWAQSNGYVLFDLMGGRDGVFQFKSSFSKERRKFFVGNRLYNHDVYEELTAITRGIMKTEFRHGFFPSYRQLESM